MGIKAVWKALTETTNDTIVAGGKIIQATGSSVTDVADAMEDYASLLKKESAKAFLGLEDEEEFNFDDYLAEKRKHYETRAELHALRKQVL